MLLAAEQTISYPDCIIRAYGVAEGPLPRSLTTLFCLPTGKSNLSVGIVMRFEGGGSLAGVIYKEDEAGRQVQVDMEEKLRLLCGIARGLAELHAVGIIHGDIKPENGQQRLCALRLQVKLIAHCPPYLSLISPAEQPRAAAGATGGFRPVECARGEEQRR